MPTKYSPEQREAAFWSKVEKRGESECWPWIAGKTAHGGYGAFRNEHAAIEHAHRVAYRLAVGPIPEDMQIDHLCHNRECCNPAHLEVVTQKENILRGESGSARLARERLLEENARLRFELNNNHTALAAAWCSDGQHVVEHEAEGCICGLIRVTQPSLDNVDASALEERLARAEQELVDEKAGTYSPLNQTYVRKFLEATARAESAEQENFKLVTSIGEIETARLSAEQALIKMTWQRDYSWKQHHIVHNKLRDTEQALARAKAALREIRDELLWASQISQIHSLTRQVLAELDD